MRRLHRRLAPLAALAAALLGPGAASAGPLGSATLSTPGGQTYTIDSISTPGLTGTWYVNGTATVGAGSAFSGIASDQPLYTNPAITNLHMSVGSNGAIRIAPAAAPASVTVTGPLAATYRYQNSYGTIFTVPLPLGAGTPGNPLLLTRIAKVPFVGSVLVTASATGWHLGTVRATGLTVNGSPVPDVTLNGWTANLQTFPSADGAFVTAVTLVHIHTTGLYVQDTALPFTLSLIWGGPADPAPTPEAGSGLLLAAAAAGFAQYGRRKRRLAA